MPRRLISFEPGMYYHLYNRGVNRQNIFFESRNYMYFLFNIERYLLPFSDLVAYCLMPNHYHILIYIRETSEVPPTSEISPTSEVPLTSEVPPTSEVPLTSEVSRAMMKLSVSYTKAINHRYNRVGPLFQGAFQAKFIDSDTYLSQLMSYIHVNPVKSGLVDAPEEWLYSSYHDYQSLDPPEVIHRSSFPNLGIFIGLGLH